VGFGILALGTGLAAGLCLLAVVAVYLSARGPARAGLASAGAALALIAPATAIAAASWLQIDSFSGMALGGSGAGAMAQTLQTCAEAGTLIRIGCGGAAFTLLLAALLGWLGRSGPVAVPTASSRRLLVLALPMFLAPAIVGGDLLQARTNRATVIEVVSADPTGATPAPRTESIGSIARRLSVGLTSCVIGLPVLLLILSGFAAATAILAWGRSIPTFFAAFASAFLVLQALAWLGAMLLFRPPALP
jgi:hypothetical protein